MDERRTGVTTRRVSLAGHATTNSLVGHNGVEPDEDSEHSLGSLNLIDQRRWNEGDGHDLQKGTTRRFDRRGAARPSRHKLRRV
jgi:hypothetical protein